jgi:Heavy metal binding domain
MLREQTRENRIDQRATGIYLCPMHPDVRETVAGKCPKCGMDLMPEGTRFALLRHMIGRRSHLAIMAALMVAAMAVAMMMIMMR